jgi:hypothetical protein
MRLWPARFGSEQVEKDCIMRAADAIRALLSFARVQIGLSFRRRANDVDAVT